MDIAIVGSGISGLTRGLRAPRGDHRVTVFESEPAPRRPRQDRDRRGADGAGPGRHGLHRLQRADLPAVRPASSPSSASRPSRATCRSGSSAMRAGSPSARAAVVGSSRDARTAARPSQWRMLADVPRFYRDARAPPRRAGAVDRHARRVDGRSRLRPRVPRPLPDPDHVGRLVDRRRPDPRLPGRLPAPLPRQPRPHRLRQRARSGASSRAAHAPMSSGSWRRSPRGAVRTGDPVVAVDRDAFGVTVRTPTRRSRRASTPSCWRPTPTTRCAAARRRRRASDASLGGFEYSTQPGRAPHRRAASCRRTRAPGRRGTCAPGTAGGPATR